MKVIQITLADGVKCKVWGLDKIPFFIFFLLDVQLFFDHVLKIPSIELVCSFAKNLLVIHACVYFWVLCWILLA